jgi:hypothetical protein
MSKKIPNIKSNLMMLPGLLFLFVMPVIAEGDHSGHDHAGHDHSKHDHKGAVNILNPIKIGDVFIKTELIGEAEPGKIVELHITISKKSSIKLIRSWIGIKNARGSRKALLKKEGDLEFFGKIDVPIGIKEELDLWYDVTLADGSRKKVHLELSDDHDDHEGHDHHDDHEGHNH